MLNTLHKIFTSFWVALALCGISMISFAIEMKMGRGWWAVMDGIFFTYWLCIAILAIYDEE